MTIKTATGIAIAGISIALLMSIGGQFLIALLFNYADMTREKFGMVQGVYFFVQAVIHYGSLLVFFIALYSRQKA